MRTLPVLFLSIAVLLSCKKDNDNNSGTNAPAVISISLPGANATYFLGSILRVNGEVTDSDGLSWVRVEVRHRTNGTVYHTQTTNTPNVSFFNFDWNWTVTGISSSIPALVKVTARDRKGNESSRDVEITLDN